MDVAAGSGHLKGKILSRAGQRNGLAIGADGHLGHDLCDVAGPRAFGGEVHALTVGGHVTGHAGEHLHLGAGGGIVAREIDLHRGQIVFLAQIQHHAGEGLRTVVGLGQTAVHQKRRRIGSIRAVVAFCSHVAVVTAISRNAGDLLGLGLALLSRTIDLDLGHMDVAAGSGHLKGKILSRAGQRNGLAIGADGHLGHDLCDVAGPRAFGGEVHALTVGGHVTGHAGEHLHLGAGGGIVAREIDLHRGQIVFLAQIQHHAGEGLRTVVGLGQTAVHQKRRRIGSIRAVVAFCSHVAVVTAIGCNAGDLLGCIRRKQCYLRKHNEQNAKSAQHC